MRPETIEILALTHKHKVKESIKMLLGTLVAAGGIKVVGKALMQYSFCRGIEETVKRIDQNDKEDTENA